MIYSFFMNYYHPEEIEIEAPGNSSDTRTLFIYAQVKASQQHLHLIHDDGPSAKNRL